MITILENKARELERDAREIENWNETPVSVDEVTGQTLELDEIDAEKWEAARGCAITALKLMAGKLRAIDRRLRQ
jgi:hypothetical protein